jgi:hypothetical protein
MKLAFPIMLDPVVGRVPRKASCRLGPRPTSEWLDGLKVRKVAKADGVIKQLQRFSELDNTRCC